MDCSSMQIEMDMKTDRALMYLIQTITKLPTSEILGFFSDLSSKVAEMGRDNMAKARTNSIRKEICDYFPGSPVPFQLLVEGGPTNPWNNLPSTFRVHARVSFPNQADYVDKNKLSEIIAEKMLLGGSDMPLFERPDTKTPKLYKQLMQEIQSRRMV